MHVRVDYEELHRMAHVWAHAAKDVAVQGMRVGALAADPAMALNAVFDPAGAARITALVGVAVAGSHGLSPLAGRLGGDAAALEAAVTKERLVDDLPISQVRQLVSWLVTMPVMLPSRPHATIVGGRADVVNLADAGIGYLSPYLEPLLGSVAPSAKFRLDALLHRQVSVDPLFGLPLDAIGRLTPEGPGYVAVAHNPAAAITAVPTSLADAIAIVGALETMPVAALAVVRVVGPDDVTRYVVELPGMRSMTATPDPQDLTGAVLAVESASTGYTRCVEEALDTAGVPKGAAVMLIGHSEGGIVAMDLAGDPHFNGGRVRVTHVLAAGAPISAKAVAPGSGTRVLSVENVNDVVTHLDVVDSARVSADPARLTYQFADDRHDVPSTHMASLYAQHLAAIADSPNPEYRQFARTSSPYFASGPRARRAAGVAGQTPAMVFTLRDKPPTVR